MAAAIEQEFPDAEIELVKGQKGAFIVLADGKELWNKHTRGGFPEEAAIVQALKGA